jgi:hypothetical protein
MCDYCGSTDGCQPVGGKLADERDLTADDWRQIHRFIKYCYLPFVHMVIMQARRRAKRKESTHGKAGGN